MGDRGPRLQGAAEAGAHGRLGGIPSVFSHPREPLKHAEERGTLAKRGRPAAGKALEEGRVRARYVIQTQCKEGMDPGCASAGDVLMGTRISCADFQRGEWESRA